MGRLGHALHCATSDERHQCDPFGPKASLFLAKARFKLKRLRRPSRWLGGRRASPRLRIESQSAPELDSPSGSPDEINTGEPDPIRVMEEGLLDAQQRALRWGQSALFTPELPRAERYPNCPR